MSAPTAMADFQSRFLEGLLHATPPAPYDPSDFRAQPAFAVYRNTFAKACIDALEANFPVVARLVGPQWIRAVAEDYLRAYPPRDARLLHYGDQFPDFLAPYAAAHGLDYLPPVARLDAAWRASHAAADAAALDPQRLAQREAPTLAATVLHLHPAACWTWCDDMPIGAIWRRERTLLDGPADAADTTAPELPWLGDGLLLTRPFDTVQWMPLPEAGCVFLDACARGLSLAEAAESALAKDPALDLGALLHSLLDAGAFHEATPP